MARSIVIWPDEVLVNPTRPVEEWGEPLEQLLAEMLKAVREAEGIGIAANQLGVPLRVALVGREDEGTFFEIVNPELLERGEPIRLNEGCLSVPDVYEVCPRHRTVKVRYQDKSGAWHELEAEDRLAHVLQHEIDHLDGHVFVDHLPRVSRTVIRDRMQKVKRRRKREE